MPHERRGDAPGVHWERPRWEEKQDGQGEELQDDTRLVGPVIKVLGAAYFWLINGDGTCW